MAMAMDNVEAPPRLLNLLPEPLRAQAITIITEVLGELPAGSNPLDPLVINAVRGRLAGRLALEQLEDGDVVMAIQDVIAAANGEGGAAGGGGGGGGDGVPAPPLPAAFVPAPIPTNDPEALISYLFSLLHAHQHAADGGESALLPVDVEISRVMHEVLNLPSQRPLARRVHAQLRTMAAQIADVEEQRGAARGQALVELIYSVILGQEGCTVARYQTQEPIGPMARRMVLRAFDAVGVYAREDPFPASPFDPCERRLDCVVHDIGDGGRVMRNRHGGTDFEVAFNTCSGRTYAFAKTLKKAIYGSVRMALVVDIDTSSGSLVWNRNGGRKVAIKCIEKAKIRHMEEKIKQRRDKSKLNEHPVKEVHCLSYITRRLNGQLGGPEAIRGDPTRVLPVVDIFEDAHFIFVVMPLMQREFFEVVDERSQGGGRFTGHEAWTYFSQLLGGLEVAHSLGLAHHDVSFENTMVDEEGKCVIIDWGMVVKVCVTDQGVPIKVAPAKEWPLVCGKLLYHCPEFVLHSDRSFDPFKLDIWAMGVMLFIMLTGVPPWSVQTGPTPTDSRFLFIIRGRLHELLAHWNVELPMPAVQLLQACLLEDPDQRPTIEQIRAFAWFDAQGNI